MTTTDQLALLAAHITVLIAIMRQEKPAEEMKSQAIHDAEDAAYRVKFSNAAQQEK